MLCIGIMNSIPGYKYNMNDLAASIGIVQLRKLNSMNQKRSKIIKTISKVFH